MYPAVMWDYFNNGASIRMINPQYFHNRVWRLCATLQVVRHYCCLAELWIRIRMDPHSISGSGSRRGKFKKKKLKECKEIGNNQVYSIFKSKFAQAPLFLTFESSLMLDPDTHFLSCWIRICIRCY